MASGHLITYVPPGVYTRTLAKADVANLVAGLRIPVVVGVGQEELEQLDLELVRGSSATLDQQIVNEDVSQRFVVDDTNPNNPILGAATGQLTKFRVRNFPIVDGNGFGRTANDVRHVSVTVNGDPVAVGAVQGANGYVVLQVPAQPGDDVRCTYFFHRSDTSFTDDVSDQVSAAQAELTTPAIAPFVVAAGTTDTLILKVDGVEHTAVLSAGSHSALALKSLIDSKAISGLATAVYTDGQGNDRLTFQAARSLEIGSGNANGALGFAAGAKTSRNRDFRVFQRPIVDGTDGGITTTDPSKVIALVNGVQVVAEAVDGTNGIVTLPYAPAAGSSVTIQYWANTWQDTFDYLPHTLVTNVIRCGFSPKRNDYIQGQDFVISNPSPDVSIVHWGASFVVASSQRTPGAEVFDDTQIIPTLVDDKLYLVEADRVVDTTVVPAVASSTRFTLPEVPTTGNGRDTPLGSDLYGAVANNRIGLNTNRPDLIVVRTGRDVRDALGRAAAKVIEVDAATRQLTLKDPVPPDHKVFATFWYNRLSDDTYILTNKVPGAVGVGQFEVLKASTNANLHQIRFGTKSGLAQTVQWPRGVENVPDAYHTGAGTPVSETVTVTFGTTATKNAAYTNPGAAPYSFYAGASDQWRMSLSGTSFTVDLDAAYKGYLVSQRVPLSGGNITVPAAPNNVLELTVDGVDITVTLTDGARTPSQIIGEINAAIDADAAFSGSAPNALASVITLGTDAVFVIQSASTPAALPGGFDHVSGVSIRQGTAESVLGFATFQSAEGSPTATVKPATLLGSEAATFNITEGVNDELNIRVNGVDYAITLTDGAAVAAATIVADINGVPGLASVASVGTLANLNKIRLTSQVTGPSSSIVILEGSANEVLGFNEGDSASSTLVSAQEVVNAINATTGVAAEGVAYVSEIANAEHITIETVDAGATVSISFQSGSDSAFNISTGTGIVAGTSGDNGEDAASYYTVSSSHPAGSSGTGYPGQTYTDARTGLRFTVLPAASGNYSDSGSFTLDVSTTWHVNPAVPSLALGGVELIVTDTVGVGVNDTSTVQTFNPGGLEPAIGDFYFISYRFRKQDFSTRLFQQFKTIEANFGRVSAENRVSLASYLAILNGAVLIGIKQVLKTPNTNQASDQSFTAAIQELSIPLPGNIKPDVLVPLTTSTAIYGSLMQHCEVQSHERNQSERMGFIGFASGTSPTSAQTIARSLQSNRIVAVYPDSAVVTLTNELGENFETLVDGTFLAAAVAGAVVSPAVDVATPYTRRKIVGVTRLPRVMDPVETNQTAVSGITILEDLDPVIRIRQGLTTDMSSLLNRLPTVTQIADFVQQQSRATLDAFVGTKFLASRTNEVEVSMTALFKQLVQAEIVGGFTGISAEIDETDPTILNFVATYMPIFPLLYIVMEFNLRARI